MSEEKQKVRGRSKTLVGNVIADAKDKTVVVAISKQTKHPAYKKFVRRTKKYFAHDEKNECRAGDQVRIIETRPLNKLKRWRIQQIVHKAVQV